MKTCGSILTSVFEFKSLFTGYQSLLQIMVSVAYNKHVK